MIKNSNGCNLAVDIWSLGCTVLEMTTAKPPWSQYEGVSNSNSNTGTYFTMPILSSKTKLKKIKKKNVRRRKDELKLVCVLAFMFLNQKIISFQIFFGSLY